MASDWTEERAALAARAHTERLAELRKERRRQVRLAAQQGRTVPYDLRTLMEDGHGLGTIKKVFRGSK